ncbi:MarR family winged helix-turn-helix transcriptional regulator [Ulvibacter litoralis]|uniref:DNA-binding transcriptional regulator, MarR family n=1 Tax=Ulvibacter litoralis TaxID=227084 RepID=A0A1G7J0Q0_9FLAO|nr:MarR family transcriptional regulator [Ulvibacter litoralis]GHC60434.1 MarR family transcriptional regulator [Ulvibacter litoralis]SDF18471.1 DNA-binding transcriptional regulator, MarR family [Ulvibacter litoralis]
MKIEEVIKSKNKMSITTKTVINLMYTSRIIEEAVVSALKPYDLTPQQFNVLRILRGQKGSPANLSTLQERMVDKNSNTTRLVDKLIKKGWVNRNTCKLNRRKVEIFITKEGLLLLETLDPITEQANEKALNNLSQQQLEDFNHLLDTLRDS